MRTTAEKVVIASVYSLMSLEKFANKKKGGQTTPPQINLCKGDLSPIRFFNECGPHTSAERREVVTHNCGYRSRETSQH